MPYRLALVVAVSFSSLLLFRAPLAAQAGEPAEATAAEVAPEP
ncbi:MAG: hypothetical protein V3T72_22395 [Thermoanaerobaculia bacterium]